jgi:hypothetical protein
VLVLYESYTHQCTDRQTDTLGYRVYYAVERRMPNVESTIEHAMKLHTKLLRVCVRHGGAFSSKTV